MFKCIKFDLRLISNRVSSEKVQGDKRCVALNPKGNISGNCEDVKELLT